MERNRTSTLGAPHQECPILCITKSIVFVFVSLFVLYLPLGDPHVYCSDESLRRGSEGICCLCNVHEFLLKVARRTVDSVEVLARGILNTLYQTKLKFYALLEKLDRDDLCRSVRCPETNEELRENMERDRPCRCTKKRCRRN